MDDSALLMTTSNKHFIRISIQDVASGAFVYFALKPRLILAEKPLFSAISAGVEKYPHDICADRLH